MAGELGIIQLSPVAELECSCDLVSSEKLLPSPLLCDPRYSFRRYRMSEYFWDLYADWRNSPKSLSMAKSTDMLCVYWTPITWWKTWECQNVWRIKLFIWLNYCKANLFIWNKFCIFCEDYRHSPCKTFELISSILSLLFWHATIFILQ